MFGWLKRKAQLAVVRQMEEDIDRFLASLRGMDSSAIALLVASANDWRIKIEDQQGWNLLDPIMLERANPLAGLHINRTIAELQKSNPFQATGLMVWLHSIRTANTPELRLKGRAMWKELRRGFPMVPEEARAAYVNLGLHLVTVGYESIPLGLEPEFT